MSKGRSTKPTSAWWRWGSPCASPWMLTRTVPLRGTFEVRVSIVNDLELLKVNMSANAEIVLEEHRGVLLIPESALIYNENRETSVEVPDPSTATGRRQVAVKTGLSNGARTELLAGVKLGDQVVLQ